MESNYYVYHHINENPAFGQTGCRYIGKGKRGRAYSCHSRNKHWHNIFSEINPPTIVLIAENLTDEQSKAIEIQQITFAKEHGVKLCNLTDGGEGNLGWIPSEETKLKLSNIMKGKRHTEKSKKKMSKSQKKRLPPSIETRIKISEANKRRPPMSDKIKEKISLSNMGKKLSLTHRLKIIESNKRRTVSDKTRQKIAEANRKRVVSDKTRQKIKESWIKRRMKIK